MNTPPKHGRPSLVGRVYEFLSQERWKQGKFGTDGGRGFLRFKSASAGRGAGFESRKTGQGVDAYHVLRGRLHAMGWVGILLWIALFGVCAPLGGCGDPEDPQIKEVQITYWDAESGAWKSLQNGSRALGSQVRLQAVITDNTAVVDPTLTLIGQRRDRDFSPQGGALANKCLRGNDDFFECELECEDDEAGHYLCSPVLQAASLIRGDLFTLTLKARASETAAVATQAEEEVKTFKIALSVREALVQAEGGEAGETIDQEYRILQVTNEQGSPNPFVWGLAYATKQNPLEPDWTPLRSGDSLQWERRRDPENGPGPIEGDEYFQVRIDQEVTLDGITYTLQDPPALSLASLVKWNQRFALSLDPKTGSFEARVQLFDPRGEEDIGNEAEAPIYRFVLEAQDVPDQGDEEFRSTKEKFSFSFSPPVHLPLPEITVNGLDEEETKQTSTASRILTGSVKNGAGEVRSLQFVLSNGKTGEDREERVQFFPLQSISLSTAFSTRLELVSDWTVSEEGENGGILNELKVVAISTREGEPGGEEEEGGGTKDKAEQTTAQAEKSFLYEFTPPETEGAPPTLELLELFPALDTSGEALLPLTNDGDMLAPEELRVWARASDGNGQPRVSYGWCSCLADNVWDDDVRQARCGEDCVQGGIPPNHLDASGRFPKNPWEWMGVIPNLPPQGQTTRRTFTEKVEQDEVFRNVAVIKAEEKDTGRNQPQFSAVEIRLDQENPPDGPFKVLLPRLVNRGPTVSLVPSAMFNAVNGELLCSFEDPDDRQACFDENFKFDGADRIIPNSVDINRIIALWNGQPRGQPSYDLDSYSLFWDLGFKKGEVRRGDRLCLGGEAVTGHKTIKLYEFTEVEGGLLVGISNTSDESDCLFAD